MKKIRILGLVTMIILILIIAAFALLAAFGVLRIEENADGSGSHIIFSPIGEKNELEMPLSGKNAAIKTELGDIVIALAESPAAEEFINLDNRGSFDGAEFSVLAKDMFIQAEVNDPAFETEKNSYACIYGRVGFVMDEEKAAPSFFIITNKKLSGLSESYMKENGFDKEKISLYEKNGGMPEYEGKVIIFGEVISGMETAEKIAKGENAGYTGGYFAENPVAIKNIEISYPTETTE